MAKSLMAAGVDVKFPDGEKGGSFEEEDLVFWILVKIGDQVFSGSAGHRRNTLFSGPTPAKNLQEN